MAPKTENSLRIMLDATDIAVEPCEHDDHAYDDELDDERSVIQDACSLLARSSDVRFVVTGFSDSPWPVDVETDLAVALEQLPDTLKALRENREATLDFYEQGIERVLEMSGKAAVVEVRCASRHTTWTPQPPSISIEREVLVSMLVQLGADFYAVLKRACGELAAHPWLAEWRRRLGPSG